MQVLFMSARRGGGVMAAQLPRRVDQAHHAERLRGVSDLSAAGRVVFLAQQPNVVAQSQQSIEQLGCLVVVADAAQRIGQPEAAGEEDALAAGQSVVAL